MDSEAGTGSLKDAIVTLPVWGLVAIGVLRHAWRQSGLGRVEAPAAQDPK